MVNTLCCAFRTVAGATIISGCVLPNNAACREQRRVYDAWLGVCKEKQLRVAGASHYSNRRSSLERLTGST